MKNAVVEEKDLADLIESTREDSGVKEAVETLHPKADADKKDRLSILTQPEISSHVSVGVLVKALQTTDLTKEFIIAGVSDKVKALKVSQGGIGRGEISTIFQPKIFGESAAQGMVLPGGQVAANVQGVQRPGFLRRMFGRS